METAALIQRRGRRGGGREGDCAKQLAQEGKRAVGLWVTERDLTVEVSRSSSGPVLAGGGGGAAVKTPAEDNSSF